MSVSSQFINVKNSALRERQAILIFSSIDKSSKD
nr:MAG TPA: hypothetical protein [Caudoviricetes sp.]